MQITQAGKVPDLGDWVLWFETHTPLVTYSVISGSVCSPQSMPFSIPREESILIQTLTSLTHSYPLHFQVFKCVRNVFNSILTLASYLAGVVHRGNVLMVAAQFNPSEIWNQSGGSWVEFLGGVGGISNVKESRLSRGCILKQWGQISLYL